MRASLQKVMGHQRQIYMPQKEKEVGVKLDGCATCWWWVRHAPVPVAGKVVYGRTDVACDVTDIATFKAQALRLPTDAVVVTSGLGRAVKTLKALKDAGYAPESEEVITEPAFEERYFGDWDGLTWDAIEAQREGNTAAFWDDPFGFRAPGGGENVSDQKKRVEDAVNAINTKYKGRNIVCVAHAGTIRCQLANVLELENKAMASLDVDYVSITRMDHYHDELEGIVRVGMVNGLYV